MKKTLFIILLLSCFAGAFAETGYANNQWGDTYLEVLNKTSAIEYNSDTHFKRKVMVGVETNVFYHFDNEDFIGVSYSLPKEKTEEIKSKFSKIITSQKTQTIPKKKFIETIKKDVNLLEKYNTDNISFISDKYAFLQARKIETVGTSQYIDNNGTGNLYIYDYNDDTRVYIFENFVEGITFVVYTYHEQDY